MDIAIMHCARRFAVRLAWISVTVGALSAALR
jgi:hypothetical protein